MQTQKRYRVADSFRGLMAAVINRALADLERDSSVIKTIPTVKDEAMAWINGPDCEAYCLVLDVDYTAIREKAVVIYRRFMEKEDTPKRRLKGDKTEIVKKTVAYSLPGPVMKKASRSPGHVPGYGKGLESLIAVATGRSTGILEKVTDHVFPLVSARRPSIPGRG
jgi:hypothetical protein